MQAKRRAPRSLSWAGLLLVAGLPIAAAALAQDDAAATFRRAREYTVRVKTQITEPFVEDERGSFEGAGFLVDAERGWILTNAHVVGQSPSDVQVAFADGSFRPARKVYVDSFTDVAVLALDAPLPKRAAARLCPGDLPGVGEAVAVFGHPLGIPFTGSRGIVSGSTDQFGAALMQIDAIIDHGNSGGPVIALRTGEVVGIATAGAGDVNAKVNFATPMRDVCHILAMLRRGVSPCPPILAFDLLADEDHRPTMRVGQTHDAERWPLEPGDRILRMADGGAALGSLGGLVSALRGRAGSAALVVERAGREVTVPVRPEFYPPVIARRGVSIDGVLIAPHEFEDGAVLREPPRLIVHSVDPGSQAEMKDFQPQDYVQSVDGRRVDDLDSLLALVRGRPEGAALSFVLVRAGGGGRRITECQLRELPGTDVHVVGPPAENGAHASR
jgi:S1-C subfamily serine protease